MLNWRDPKNPRAGGAERVSQAYLEALIDRGHEAWWFTHEFEGCQREETVSGIHIVREGTAASSWRRAKRWLRTQEKFDLVIDQHHGIPWYAPWWCRTNCVAYIHEVLGPIWDAFYQWPLSSVGRFQERWTHWAYRNTQFFTASSCTRDKLADHGVRQVQIIPYGVHTKALPDLPSKPLTDPLRLIVVSRLAPNKRIDHAVRALRELLNRGVKAKLAIVGGGEEEGRLRDRVIDLNIGAEVEFTGMLPEKEKDARLRDSHFLLHTSQREGWGLNVIEANAMGAPAIVYPVEGLTESTLHEKTGLVAKEETPESLADAIESAAKREDDYQRWRVAAWERAKEFHWDKVLPKASDWLEEMAKRPRD